MKLLSILLSSVICVILFGCTVNEPKESADMSIPTETVTEPTPVSDNTDLLSDDNPIDRAFSRTSAERGDDGNIIFAYLYAKKWKDTFYELQYKDADTQKLYDFDYKSKTDETALKYGKAYAESPVEQYFEIGRYYKLLTYDFMLRQNEVALSIDEDELYQFLNEVNYDVEIPDSFDYFDLNRMYDDKLNPMPVIAAISDGDIYFMYSEIGAVLSVRGTKFLMDWSNYLTPRAILPHLSEYDYDNDGREEITVILYVGSGTGYSVEELHIVDTEPELAAVRDTIVTGEMIKDLLAHRFTAVYDPNTDEVTFCLDDQTVKVDASRVDKEKCQEFRYTDFESIVIFEVADGILKTQISVGLCGFDWVMPFDYVVLYSDLNCDDWGNITLSNCRIEYIAY